MVVMRLSETSLIMKGTSKYLVSDSTLAASLGGSERSGFRASRQTNRDSRGLGDIHLNARLNI
jgi:hypothetical protein